MQICDLSASTPISSRRMHRLLATFPHWELEEKTGPAKAVSVAQGGSLLDAVRSLACRNLTLQREEPALGLRAVMEETHGAKFVA